MSTLEMILAGYFSIGAIYALKFYIEWKSRVKRASDFGGYDEDRIFSWGVAFTMAVGFLAWPFPLVLDLSDWASKRK